MSVASYPLLSLRGASELEWTGEAAPASSPLRRLNRGMLLTALLASRGVRGVDGGGEELASGREEREKARKQLERVAKL